MTKRVNIPMSLNEIELVLEAFQALSQFYPHKASQNMHLERIQGILEERKIELDEENQLSRIYTIDDEGYEVLTDYGKRVIKDCYGDSERKKDE